MRSERWSNSKEIKHVLSSDKNHVAGGPILYCENGHRWTFTNEGHTIFLGVSGTGKSRRGTIPMIRSFAEASESFIAVDPKGEIFTQTKPFLNDSYKTHVIDFRHVLQSERWNPLASIRELYSSGDPVKKQVGLEMLDELAYTLYPTQNQSEAFWANSARSCFVACAMLLFEYAMPEQVTISNVYQVIAKGDERHGISSYLKDFVNRVPSDSIVAMLLHNYVTAANETRASIRSVFLEGISLFARSEGLVSMMGGDDLDINRLDGEVPTAIYIILPDESPIYDTIVGVLVSQLMGHYVRLAQDEYGGRLPRRINICLEELGNIGKSVPSLSHIMSAGRSRNVRCQLVLQSLSQLDTIFGHSDASTIRSNADVLVAFRTNHWETLTELSRKCGEREIDKCGHIVNESLITPSQLGAMKTGQALIMISGSTKFISQLPDYEEIYDCSEWREPMNSKRSERSKVVVFDIREYVSETTDVDMLTPIFGDSRIHCREEKRTNVDDVIARIDAQIAKIEAKERLIEGGLHPKFESDPCEIVLLSHGEDRDRVLKVLRDITGMSPKSAEHAVNNTPYNIKLSTIEAAKEAYKKLTEAGALVISEF